MASPFENNRAQLFKSQDFFPPRIRWLLKGGTLDPVELIDFLQPESDFRSRNGRKRLKRLFTEASPDARVVRDWIVEGGVSAFGWVNIVLVMKGSLFWHRRAFWTVIEGEADRLHQETLALGEGETVESASYLHRWRVAEQKYRWWQEEKPVMETAFYVSDAFGAFQELLRHAALWRRKPTKFTLHRLLNRRPTLRDAYHQLQAAEALDQWLRTTPFAEVS